MSSQNNHAANGTCPLCDSPARVQLSQQIAGNSVICERCGSYRIEYNALIGFEQQRHLIAGLTRRASTPEPRVTSRLTLTQDNIAELLATSGLPGNLLDQLDITLEYAKEHQQRSDKFFNYSSHVTTDYPRAFSRDQE